MRHLASDVPTRRVRLGPRGRLAVFFASDKVTWEPMDTWKPHKQDIEYQKGHCYRLPGVDGL